jgi:broad specificity phosphatase PhoE
MFGRIWRIVSALLAVLSGLAFGFLAGAGIVRAQAADPLALMREGGNVLLVRHAATEAGVGDPPEFRLGDCRSQRNLSAAGRDQARKLGEALRAAGIPMDAVRSSRWCRCVDTARLAFEPQVAVETWPALDSFFGDRGAGPAQTRAALDALAALPARSNWVWVTHQVNISALTGSGAAPGEVIVARPVNGALRVLGRWRP